MNVEHLAIPDVKLIIPRRFADTRGYFSETWNRRSYAKVGIDVDFVQDNFSLSRSVGTVRGLHFQTNPFAQGKLVRVLKGQVFDVAVDLRRRSNTYGEWVSAILTSENGEQLYIPPGFAHGFATLQPDTEVSYKVTNYYSPENDCGVRWDDPQINVAWPVHDRPVISEKDEKLPFLAELEAAF